MTAEEAEKFFPDMVSGAGSCVGLYTANTMAVVIEVLGMSITKCSTALAIDPHKKRQAYESGRRIVELVKKDIEPRDVVKKVVFKNTIRVDIAMGGSTITVLHIPAVAKEVVIDIDVSMFEVILRETPNLCSIIPAGSHEMTDIDTAGGIPGVLNRLIIQL